MPLLRKTIAARNVPFAATILTKSELEPVTSSANKVHESPLLHGETNCQGRLSAACTHEPCPLCFRGISWTGFPIVYPLFNYEDSRDLFGSSGDLELIQEVCRVRAPGDADEILTSRPLYNRNNKFFTARSVAELLTNFDAREREHLRMEVKRVKDLFLEFKRE